MKYCSHCGKQLDDQAVFCPGCGFSFPNVQAVADAPSTGFAVLGFLIPLVGLILYLVNKDTMPLKAKSAGKGALIGFISGIVFYGLIYGVIIGSILSYM